MEQKHIDLILDIYATYPEKFEKLKKNGKISVNVNQRLNYNRLIYENAPVSNRILNIEKPKNESAKKQKGKKSTPVYDPDYNPNDAMNHRLPGSFGTGKNR